MRRTVRLGSSEHRGGADANSWMTPMIDVLFQLLIYFLCTTGYSEPESLLPTELPAEAKQARPAKQRRPADEIKVVIGLHDEPNRPSIELNGRALNGLADLRQQLIKLARASQDLRISLDISPTVTLERIVQVYDECLAAGLSKVSFPEAKLN